MILSRCSSHLERVQSLVVGSMVIGAVGAAGRTRPGVKVGVKTSWPARATSSESGRTTPSESTVVVVTVLGLPEAAAVTACTSPRPATVTAVT